MAPFSDVAMVLILMGFRRPIRSESAASEPQKLGSVGGGLTRGAPRQNGSWQPKARETFSSEPGSLGAGMKKPAAVKHGLHWRQARGKTALPIGLSPC
jgi:hypothetical protein